MISLRPGFVSVFSVLVAMVASSAAQAQSNSCSSATVIGDGTFMGTTVGATNDGAASCGGSATSPDVWYSYTPIQSCTLNLDTCGSAFDTVLSAHTACPATTGNQIACNDDSCGLQSRIQFAATAGTAYLIRVAGFSGATGTFTLNVSCAGNPNPGSDSCANAVPVTIGSVSGTTAGSTNDGSASCGSSATSPDVWYSFAATEHCRMRANVCGASFDTVLSIHSGCPGTTANQISCNDDSCGLSSSVAAEVQAGNTYLIRVAGFNGATGAFTLNVSCTPIVPGSGPDIITGELSSLAQLGRLGDVVGCGLQSTICNAGSDPLDWVANPDPHHPFIVGNVYRMMGGRFEQIGQSWAKHAFAAAQADECSLGCTPTGGTLGVGCSDTYGASLNGAQNIMGPREEINPWTGSFTYPGSYIQTHTGGFDAVEHRLRIHDADLDPAQNAGATYVVELYVLAHDDVNHMNSLGWEPSTITGTPGGSWSFNLNNGTHTTVGPAIEAWNGATRTTIQDPAATDGRCILGVRTSDNGNGTWHYEYSLYNLDMDRQVNAFTIPASSNVNVTNAGFHAVESEADDGFSNAPWTFTRMANAITWATEPFATNPHSNPLRWGTTYSFRFDADVAPSTVTATLDLYKPGSPASLTGSTQGPTSIECLAGTVGTGAGPAADVLFVNGSAGDPVTRVVDVALSAPITVALSAAPGGPNPAHYVAYRWQGPPSNSTVLVVGGQTLGCTANPTPLNPGLTPQPFRCLRGAGVPASICGSVTEFSGAPARAPWTRTRPQGFASTVTFTLQGILEDGAAANSLGYSVTNAVVISVHP
ncbi:MAG: hypothetical protein HY292_07940 [Planctomycetes bacterium]|nr:hypothetical protein [Planctomycetota bacterium]